MAKLFDFLGHSECTWVQKRVSRDIFYENYEQSFYVFSVIKWYDMSGDIVELRAAMKAVSNGSSFEVDPENLVGDASPPELKLNNIKHDPSHHHEHDHHHQPSHLSVADVLKRAPPIRQSSASTFLCPDSLQLPGM